ncbi:aminotransferase class V-fold PLP-dependent enzyme [Mesorhizobium sp. LCM 4577]|uniref:aminotransferase class V-fold PLP-dependent enzyme n=1 Tax=Mesorhizobium sp. LCM 4577 TaxID=1848288 RepID=UPI0009F251C0|nr:aminotransferase class V-fold PLP-dependent enzyme [Mesorhizobium sp. LCM 4577]
MVVYLDMAATTPTDRRVAELVLEYMTREFGNAGSRTHAYGADALAAVNAARAQIARTIKADASDVLFTSGATEADNLAILGLAEAGRQANRRHLVSTSIEHKAVLEPLQHLAATGFEVTLVSPDKHGRVSPSDVLAAVRPDTLLVSIMHANNETGVVQPIEAVADALHGECPYLHVDAAQTFGRLNRALSHPRIDLISLSGHKIYAPKGIGALIMKRRSGRRAPIAPLMFGGGQERGLRPGTLPVPLIVGLGLAAELAEKEREQRLRKCVAIRMAALEALAPLSPHVHGEEDFGVLPHILSVSIPGVDSEAAMVATKDIVAISNGSACTSASYQPSHVLEAMRVPADVTAGTVRISWSHETQTLPWGLFASRLNDLRF